MNETEQTTDSLLGHLAELRTRLLVSVLVWLLCSAGCYMFVEHILAWLTNPLANAFEHPDSKRMIFTSLPEAFMTYVKLALFGGFLASFPLIVSQLYRFIAPGLYREEKGAVLPFLIAAPLLFYAGAALAYFYIFPLAWQFFVGFEMAGKGVDGLAIELEAKLSDYLKLVTSIMIAFGLAFQLPLGLVLMVRAGVVQTASLAKGRKYAVVALLVTAAILTPPDIISQIGLFGALYLLYELAILAGKAVEKHKD